MLSNVRCGEVKTFTCIYAHACVLGFGSLAVVFWVHVPAKSNLILALSPETHRDSWE